MAIDGPEERMSGLLAILIVILLVVVPVADLFTAFSSVDSLAAASRDHPSFGNYLLYVWTSAGVSGLLSISLGLILARGRSSFAVYGAVVGIWLLGPVHGVVTTLVERLCFADLLAASNFSDGLGIVPRLLLSLIGPIFWSLYLISSEKVAKIYGFRRPWSDGGPSTTAMAAGDLAVPTTSIVEEVATPVAESEWIAVKSYMSRNEETALERDRAALAANRIEYEVRQAHMVTVFVKGRDLDRAHTLINGSSETGDSDVG